MIRGSHPRLHPLPHTSICALIVGSQQGHCRIWDLKRTWGLLVILFRVQRGNRPKARKLAAQVTADPGLNPGL